MPRKVKEPLTNITKAKRCKAVCMAPPKGHPRYGGRTKGTRNKRDIVREAEAAEIREGALASGLTPVEYMLVVMRDPTALPDRRDRMAAAAAPFIHPRLNAIDARVDVRQHTVHDTSAADVLGLKRKFFGVGEELPALPGLDEDGKPGEGG